MEDKNTAISDIGLFKALELVYKDVNNQCTGYPFKNEENKKEEKKDKKIVDSEDESEESDEYEQPTQEFPCSRSVMAHPNSLEAYLEMIYHVSQKNLGKAQELAKFVEKKLLS